jgi:hypothetical protein
MNGLEGSRRRAFCYYQSEDIDEEALKSLVRGAASLHKSRAKS